MELDVEYSEEASFADSPLQSPVVSQAPVLWVGSAVGFRRRIVPTIAFGIVREGQRVSSMLRVRNTQSDSVQLTLSQASVSLLSDLGLLLRDSAGLPARHMCIRPEDDAALMIDWCPQGAGSLQLAVSLEKAEGDSVISYRFDIVGCAVPLSDAITKLSTFQDIESYQLRSPLSLKLKTSLFASDKENRILQKSMMGQKTPLKSRPLPTRVCDSPFSPSRRFEFVTRHELFDEQWMEKQEAAFTKWINFELAKWRGSSGVSARQQAACRKVAYRLFSSEPIQVSLGRLAREFEVRRLRVKADLHFKLDVGLRSFLVELFAASYDPRWLHLALESVMGRPLECDQSRSHLKAYLFDGPGKDDAMIVRKMLSLILLSDTLAAESVLPHCCCLFRKESAIKTSRDLLVAVGAKVLLGEGDLVRHLNYLGYRVTYSQSPLDEIDAVVHSLATDLRDGLQLARLAAALAPDSAGLLHRLKPQSPAHNVVLLFDYFKSVCLDLSYGSLGHGLIAPSDIVAGHREKTLALLWKMICRWKIPSLVDVALLEREIQRIALTHSHEPLESISFVQNLAADHGASHDYISLLFEWAWNVCATFGYPIENFCSSFGDGKAFCCILAYYQPELLASDAFERLKGPWMELFHSKIGLLGGFPSLIAAKDLSGPFPDEKVVMTLVAYLSSRLFAMRRESQAASRIAKAWLRHSGQSAFSSCQAAVQRMRGVAFAVSSVQAWRVRYWVLAALASTLALQSHFRGASLRRQAVGPLQRAVLALQAAGRRLVSASLATAQTRLVPALQSRARGRASRAWDSKVRHGRVVAALQRGRRVRELVAVFRHSLALLQRTARAKLVGTVLRGQTQTLERSIVMQSSLIRRCLAAKTCRRQQEAVVQVQFLSKGHLTRKRKRCQQHCIQACQAASMGLISRAYTRRFVSHLTCTLQGWLVRCRVARWCAAVTTLARSHVLQARTLGARDAIQLALACARRYLVQELGLRPALSMAIYAQSWTRCQVVSMDAARLCRSMVFVQSQMRSRYAQQALHLALRATIQAQSLVRGLTERSKQAHYRRAKHVVQSMAARLHIARHVRRHRLRREGPWMTVLQSFSHGHLSRAAVARGARATRELQSWLRGLLVRRCLSREERAMLVLQACVRGLFARQSSDARVAAHRRKLKCLPTSPELTLGHRMLSGLASLASARSMSPILSACVHLEAATRLSPSCCMMLLDHSAISTLLAVISSGNRSLPCLQVAEMALRIFRNILSHAIAPLNRVLANEVRFLWHVLGLIAAQKDHAAVPSAGHEVQHKIFGLGTLVLAGLALATQEPELLCRSMENVAEFKARLCGLIKFLEKKHAAGLLLNPSKKRPDTAMEQSLHALRIVAHHIEQHGK